MENLTKKQQEILDVIKIFIAKHSYPPTIREIGKIMNLNSSATTFFHVCKLEEKGYIKKDSEKNRALELLVENEFITGKELNIKIPFFKNLNDIEKDVTEFIRVPSCLKKGTKDIFILKINNDYNMINIFKNDILAILKTKIAKDNEIILVKDENGFELLKAPSLKKVVGKVIGIYKKN